MTKAFFRAVFTACMAGSFSLAQSPPAPRTATSTPPLPTPVHQVVAYKVVPAAPVKLTVQTFDVADLNCPAKDSPLSNPSDDPAMKAAVKAFTEYRAEELCKKIRSQVECESWSELGGSGTLDVTPNGKTLVVRNSAAAVEQVGKCLESIRKLRDTQVMVEVVVLNAQSDHPAIQALFGDKETVPVTAEKMSKLLAELKKEGAVQVVSQPKMVVLNNQTGFFQVGQQVPVTELIAVTGSSSQPMSRQVPVFSSGLTVRATPKVSADQKFVELKMEVEITTPSASNISIGNGQFATAINCQKSEKTICLMDGNMLSMKVFKNKREARTENSFPGLERIPYLNRLFTYRTSSTVMEDTIVVVSTKLLSAAPDCQPPTCTMPMPVEAPIPLMPRVVPQPAPFQPALLVQPAPFGPTPLIAPPLPNRGPMPGDRSQAIEMRRFISVPDTSDRNDNLKMLRFTRMEGTTIHTYPAPPMSPVLPCPQEGPTAFMLKWVSGQAECPCETPAKADADLVGNIQIVGNTATARRVILNQLKDIVPGQKLDYAKLKEARERLIRLDIFDKESPPKIEVLERQDPANKYRDIQVTVKETRTGMVGIQVGVNSNQPICTPDATAKAKYALPQEPTAPVFIQRIDSEGLERIGLDFSTMPSGSSAALLGAMLGSAPSEITRATEISPLMNAYRAACRAGKKDEAARLALQLLAEDPTCFGLGK